MQMTLKCMIRCEKYVWSHEKNDNIQPGRKILKFPVTEFFYSGLQ